MSTTYTLDNYALSSMFNVILYTYIYIYIYSVSYTLYYHLFIRGWCSRSNGPCPSSYVLCEVWPAATKSIAGVVGKHVARCSEDQHPSALYSASSQALVNNMNIWTSMFPIIFEASGHTWAKWYVWWTFISLRPTCFQDRFRSTPGPIC